MKISACIITFNEEENIHAACESVSWADGYRLARRTFYMGRWIRGGGWYPDFQLRLFNRRHGSWGDRLIHESFAMNPGSRVETLAGDLLHYTVRDTAHHQQMIEER